MHLLTLNTNARAGARRRASRVYSDGATALFARFSAEPSGMFKDAIDDFFLASGVADAFAKLDAFYCFATHDAQSRTRNWVADQYNLTFSGTFEHIPGVHSKATGATAHATTGAALNALSKLQQNSASMFAYLPEAASSDLVIGNDSATDKFRMTPGATNVALRLNDDTTYLVSHGGDGTGLFAGVRENATQVRVWNNGAFVGTGSSSSDALFSGNITFFRNNASYSDGPVSFAGFGATLTDADLDALYAAMQAYLNAVKPRDFLFIGAGQSNMRRYEDDSATGGSGDGTAGSNALTRVFRPALQAMLDAQYDDGIYNRLTTYCGTTAFGSSAVLKAARTSNYWWDESTGTQGVRMDDFDAALAGVSFGNYHSTVLAWGQGEEEVSSTDTVTDWETYTKAVLADFRDKIGASLPLVLQPLGRNSLYNSRIATFRDKQDEFPAEVSNLIMSGDVADILRKAADDWHGESASSDQGYDLMARRLAGAVAYQMGCTAAIWRGPELASAAANSATQIDVTISYPANCGGTDFTPTTGIEGFRVTDSVGVKAISAAVRQSATVIRLTVATLAAGTVTVEYDPMASSVTRTNIVRDNNSTPFALRLGSVQFTYT